MPAMIWLRFALWINLLGMLAAPSIAIAHDDERAYPANVPAWQLPTQWPDRVIATVTADPTTSFSVSWRTNSDVELAEAQLAKAQNISRFDFDAQTYPATTEAVDLTKAAQHGNAYGRYTNHGFGVVHTHSVTFSDLEPGTTYAFRVRGAARHWSEWFHLTTAPPANAPLKFLYFGDAQNGVLSHWSRVIRAAFAMAPDASVSIHAGDMVERASRDYEWAEWFRAGAFVHARIPAVAVAGNHEYDVVTENGRALSPLWRTQFRLPLSEELPPALQETVYEVNFPQVDIYVLDTNVEGDLRDAQARWLDERLTASTTRWRIVTSHTPIFRSAANRADDPWLHAAIRPILSKHRVDLVLQGHDHVYMRGHIEVETVTDDEHGAMAVQTVFVNSMSGPKGYRGKSDGWDGYSDAGAKLARTGENVQFFHVGEIDHGRLTLTTYTALGEVYDAFTLEKDREGRKRLVELPVDLEEITFAPNDPALDFKDFLDIYPQ